MKVLRKDNKLTIEGGDYKLKYCSDSPMYIDMEFDNGIGAEFFIASGCDRDEMIDEVISLGEPEVKESGDVVEVMFSGKTTLWEKAEYTFKCFEDKVLYSYKV